MIYALAPLRCYYADAAADAPLISYYAADGLRRHVIDCRF